MVIENCEADACVHAYMNRWWAARAVQAVFEVWIASMVRQVLSTQDNWGVGLEIYTNFTDLRTVPARDSSTYKKPIDDIRHLSTFVHTQLTYAHR